jgi:acetyl-CoA C-acetyltransferase
MADKVGIVACSRIKFAAERKDVSIIELAAEAVEQVCEETGLKFGKKHGEGIDSATLVSDDIIDGKTLSDTQYGDILGGFHQDNVKVPQDGIQAVNYSAATIMGGHDDVILILGIVKESAHKSRFAHTNYGFDPIYQRPVGLTHLSAAAIQANQIMHKYGLTRAQFAQVVEKNSANAVKNPVAFAEPVSTDDVLSAEMLSDPIGALDVSPVADGAVAMILATEKKARKLTIQPVWVTGGGSARDAHYLASRDLTACPALGQAAGRAYRMAGISDPKKEVDVFELVDNFSYQELLHYEGLGLCEPGQGAALLESGATQIGGELPVNPSGGVMGGVPVLIHGLSRVTECVMQLKGEAGDYQIDGAETAVAQGCSGPCGQLQSVLVLSSDSYEEKK